MRQLRLSGMNGFIFKPVDVRKIAQSLREFLATDGKIDPSLPQGGECDYHCQGCLNIFNAPLLDPEEAKKNFPRSVVPLFLGFRI
jgi:hypothetical protein